MKVPKTLDNLFQNTYFLYFIAFLAIFNVFTYIIINNFNAIVMFILIAYITYLFSKNMAIVLLVALLLTNLFMTSNKNRKEGMENNTTESSDTTDASGNNTDASGNNTDASGNNSTQGIPMPSEAPTTTNSNTNKKNTQSTITPTTTSTTESLNNMQNFDIDKMNNLLTKSKELMNELKSLPFSGLNLPGITK
jgi:hypothetical protein